MKKLKRLILITLFTLCFGTTFSQTADSLGVSPNPFSSSAIIHFELAQADTITLEVLHVTGQTVLDLFQSTFLPKGIYNINLPGDSLADGIYIIRLEIGSTKSLVKKVIKFNSTTDLTDINVTETAFFPNPTSDLLTIPVDGKKRIVVTDLNGRVLRSFTTDQQTISLSYIAAGQYFVTVLSDKHEIITTQKIVKAE